MTELALYFLAGIVSVQQLQDLPDLQWLMPVIAVAGVMVWRKHWRCVFLVSGILWAVAFASIRLTDRLSEGWAGNDIQIKGVIAGLPEYESNHVRFNFAVAQSVHPVPGKIRLTWYYPNQTVKAGQAWSLTVRLKPPHGNFNPGGFDYERWLFVEGIGATGYVRTQPAPKLMENGLLIGSIQAWRQLIAEKLEQILSDNASLPLIKALTIGDGDSLTSEQWDIFRKTGTTHLMVISGSHIALVAGLVYLLTVKLWARSGSMAWPPQKAAALAAMAIALFYAGLTGFSVPAQRAALMVAIAMVAIVRQRNTRPYSVLAVALFAVLLIDPLIVLSPGFWLSFTAVGLIIYVIAGRLSKPGFFRGGVKVNWATSIGLSPLLLVFFQQVSVISPLANLIAVPVISLAVVPLALSATIVLFIALDLARILFIPVDWALQGVWWVLVNLAELPLAAVNHSPPSLWAVAFAAPGILLLFAPKGIPSRWLGTVMLFPLIFTETDNIAPGTVKLTLLDVGQGLSAVVQTATHTLVYDTGAKFSSDSDSGQSVVVPFLRSQDIDKVDTLIVSHGDNDHIGGAASVMAAMDPWLLLTSVPQELSDYTPVQCKAGQSWSWDKVDFNVLSPEPGNLLSDNNNSCVLQIRSQQGTLLLPGDIEAEAESWLVNTYGETLCSDVLVAPHHGSRTSSTPVFLEAVKPEIILIPAGYRNPFGHPHEDIIRRYRDLPVNWFNSADDGAVQIMTSASRKALTWRKEEGKYWNYKQ